MNKEILQEIIISVLEHAIIDKEHLNYQYYRNKIVLHLNKLFNNEVYVEDKSFSIPDNHLTRGISIGSNKKDFFIEFQRKIEDNIELKEIQKIVEEDGIKILKTSLFLNPYSAKGLYFLLRAYYTSTINCDDLGIVKDNALKLYIDNENIKAEKIQKIKEDKETKES